MRAKRILIADDDPQDVELALASLAEHNLAEEVAVVRDGAEALDYLYRRGPFANRPAELPTVAFLDLKMPKVDGLEVLRQVKADPMLKTVPIVILTSSREEQDIVESYTHHANAYVVKPVGFDEFAKVVKQLSLFWAVTNESPPRMTNERFGNEMGRMGG